MMENKDCDVLVVGGGSAGLAAGVAAARQGARTLLVERHGFLGGMATAALVHSICGLYRMRENGEAGPVFANGGIAREFAERQIAEGASPGPVRMGRLDVLPHHPAGFVRVADLLTAAESNLRILYHTEIIDVNQAGGEWTLRWICRGSTGAWRTKTIVDASGDGTAVALAGGDVEQTPAARLQRPAYIFGLSGISAESVREEARLKLAHSIVEGIRKGSLPKDALGAHFRGIGNDSEVFCTLDLAAEGSEYDPTSPDSLTAIELRGREVGVSDRSSFRLAGFAIPSASGRARKSPCRRRAHAHRPAAASSRTI